MTSAYYNEIDPEAAAWIEELIAMGMLPPGDVDRRSIVEVTADDVRGYDQVHMFAGIGGWPYALRMAGWPDSRPVWSGSPPCQPFSVAGIGRGTTDARHLWPEFRRLVAECMPSNCFGEQVASPAGRRWLAGVRADLEAMGYAVGAADLCAAGTGKKTNTGIGQKLADALAQRIGNYAGRAFLWWWRKSGLYALFDCCPGAPHIRQRLYWYGRLSNCDTRRRNGVEILIQPGKSRIDHAQASGSGVDGRLRDTESDRHQGCGFDAGGQQERQTAQGGLPADHRRLFNTECQGLERHSGDEGDGGKAGRDNAEPRRPVAEAGDVGRMGNHEGDDERRKPEPGRKRQIETGRPGGQWSIFDIIPFRDRGGCVRRIEPGTQPLVDGIPSKVVYRGAESAPAVANVGNARKMRLRGYGNAITAPIAVVFVKAAMETEGNRHEDG